MTHDMYQQNILDHARKPRHFHVLESANVHHHQANPLCGDEVEIFLKYDSGSRVAEASFTGRGCAISQAAASMLTEALVGKTKTEVEAMGDQDMIALLGVNVNPARMTCATLGLKAAQTANRAG